MTPHLMMEINSFDCLGEVHIISGLPVWERLTQALHIWLVKRNRMEFTFTQHLY